MRKDITFLHYKCVLTYIEINNICCLISNTTNKNYLFQNKNVSL